ncbi:MAG: NYN domain-containing protein [Acidobacteria bacterium]|nr:NYN domain-containing protein [Acidobacteriota bacterium]
MRHIIDGSNLLGALGLARESEISKRELVQRLASFSRAARCKVDCVFDGQRPDGFATHLGGLSIRFAHPRSGDDVIGELVATTAPAVVVTNDRALGARVKSRKVSVESCAEFRAKLDRTGAAEGDARTDGTDWESYFSDAKNRNV